MKARRFLTIMAVAAGVLWALGGPAVRADVAAGATKQVPSPQPVATVTLPADWVFEEGTLDLLFFHKMENVPLSFVRGTFKIDSGFESRSHGPAEQQILDRRKNFVDGLYGRVKDVSEPVATTMGGKPAFGIHAYMAEPTMDYTRYIIMAGGGPESVYILTIEATSVFVGSALEEQIGFICGSIKFAK